MLEDGRVVEAGRVADVLSHRREEYARALVDAIPRQNSGAPMTLLPRDRLAADTSAEGVE